MSYQYFDIEAFYPYAKEYPLIFLINFHLMGEPETSICCVTKGSQSFTIASTLR